MIGHLRVLSIIFIIFTRLGKFLVSTYLKIDTFGYLPVVPPRKMMSHIIHGSLLLPS